MEKIPQSAPKSESGSVMEGQEGASLSPPAFQLKASTATSGSVVQRQAPQVPGSIRYLRDILSLNPVPTSPPTTVRDHVRTNQIVLTEEFRSLMDPSLVWQRDYQLTYEQAVETCYAILVRLHAGGHVDWQVEARNFVRASILVESNEEQLVAGATNQALIGPLRPVVDDFRADVAAATNVAGIRAAVTARAAELWTKGRAQTQTLAPSALSGADRPMYWARNEMRRILRANPILRQPAHLGEMQQLIRLLEDNSRGSQDLDGFRTAPSGLKRILITGFDPFGGGTSNPSGIVAQRLDGRRMRYNGTENAIVQSITFPVRYDDFDHGMVERLVGPIINNSEYNVSLVITISLDGGAETINLDRFSANTRRGHSDNGNIDTHIDYPPLLQEGGVADLSSIGTGLPGTEYLRMANETRSFLLTHYPNVGPVPVVPAISTRPALITWLEGPVASFYQRVFSKHFQPRGDAGAEFIESNMDLEHMIGDSHMPSTARVHQDFTAIDAHGHLDQQTSGRDLAQNASEYNLGKRPDASHTAVEGSGGDYLSNEIYHRVSTLRTTAGHPIRNVHIHIPAEGAHVAGKSPSTRFTADQIVSEVEQVIGVAAHHN
jgi:pyrrolidone-carboxylate peptidase